jgi:hypothetical protein
MLSPRPADGIFEKLELDLVTHFKIPILAFHVAFMEENVPALRTDNPAGLAANEIFDATPRRLPRVDWLVGAGALVWLHQYIRYQV